VSSEGTLSERRAVVAQVATRLFGASALIIHGGVDFRDHLV